MVEYLVIIPGVSLRYDINFVKLDLIPVLGKTISLFFAIALYRLACSANISHEVKSTMRWHTTVNFVVSLAE